MQNIAIVFDASTFAIFGSLLNGLTLYPIQKNELLDFAYLEKYIKENKINIINLTVSFFNKLIEYNPKIFEDARVILIGGEEALPKTVNVFRKNNPQVEIVNVYGPTENSNLSCCHIIKQDYKKSVPIGIPVSNSTCYILDKNQNLLPTKVPGEIYVGGDGVALGYLNNPELTNEKFIKNPFGEGKLYKTGDLGYWEEKGAIQFSGRIDFQIKIRGFRIELKEIEAKILEYGNIQECAVITSGNDASKILVACIASKNDIDTKELNSYLKTRLPHYMVPVKYICMKSLPLNINGKLDTKLLKASINEDVTKEIIPSRNKTDKVIIDILNELFTSTNTSITDSFFDLGGDSLSAISFASKLSKEFSTNITVQDIFKHAIVKDLSDYISTLTENTKQNIIQKIKKRNDYPISSAQKRIYYASSLDNNSTLYNIAGGIIVDQTLDIKKLEECFRTLVSRHEALRTHFEMKDNDVIQIIEDNINFSLELEHSPTENLNEIYSNFVKPFDLSKSPLFRTKLVNLKNNRTLLLLDMHHIISDGTSLSILLQELCDLYNGSTLSEKQIDYKDFTLWEKEQFETEKFKKTKEFWVNQYKDEIPLLNMPTTYARPSVQSFEGSNYNTKLSKEVFEKVNEIAKKLNITPYMLLLAVYYILLSKYTSQDDIVIGSPIVGRELPELSNVLGMFVNTLALRNKVNHSSTFEDFSKSIKQNCLDSFENGNYPFDMLVKDLNITRDTSRNPLFDVMFVYQNNGYPKINLQNANVEYFIPENNVSKFDLTLEVTPMENEYSLRFEYCTKLFDDDFIKRFASHYINILTAILENNEIKIADIDMLSEQEKHQILYEFNDTKVDYPKDKTIVDLFEEQVEKTPDNIAVVFEDQKLTYKELNEKANQLARFLMINNISSKETIGIMIPRSTNTIICMLAILKLGCAYLLIDYSLPKDRITYMLENSNTNLLITNTETSSFDFENQVILDDISMIYSNENINLNLSPENRFSIIYTSGSTGTPKGITLTHLGVNNMVHNYIKVLDINRCSTFLSISSVAFDMFIVEVFITILTGKKLILSNEEQQKIPLLIHDLIKMYNVNFILTTPSRINLMINQNLLQDLLSIKIIQLGGEVLTPELYNKLSKITNAEIYNGYGPSEITACCSSKKVYNSNISIGKPFNNFNIYILSKNYNLCPIGVPGEICISGDGLALGYINNKDLTTKSFVKNPFNDTMMYKTGDLGILNKNNELEYIGRKDDQIKIHGLRIELAEIESKLLEIDSISDCCVIYKKDKEYISAFTVSRDTNINISTIRNILSKSLPFYMIPKYITQISSLPITPNGKIDKKALYTYAENISSNLAVEKPVTEKERLCCSIWQELLGHEIGTTDNIFDVGADSLLAIQFKTKMLANNIDIPYSDIFKYPTIKDLCNKAKDSTSYSIDTYDYSKINHVLEKNTIENMSTLIHNDNNNILLLGSNGFVGMHILFNFLMLDKGNIYCIIRDKNNKLANDRFLDTLHFYFGNRLDKYINKRIFIIKGNILKENFGLSTKNLDIIKDNVDIVLNSAALVKHYGTEENFHKINIDSTKNTINFCKHFNKRLIHISSLSVSGNDTLEGNTSNNLNTFNITFSEKNLYIGQKINNLYVKSKFEAEKLILENISDGVLQAQILRLGNITSRFSDGVFQINSTENSFVNKLTSLLRIGYIPNNLLNLYLEFTPVDICGMLIILILQNYAKDLSVFHLYNDNHIYVEDFIKMLSDINVNLKVVDKQDFKIIIDKLLSNNSNFLNGIINDFNSDKQISYTSNINILSEFSKAFLYKIGFTWPIIDMDYITKYIQYFKNIHLIEEN